MGITYGNKKGMGLKKTSPLISTPNYTLQNVLRTAWDPTGKPRDPRVVIPNYPLPMVSHKNTADFHRNPYRVQ